MSGKRTITYYVEVENAEGRM